MTIHWLVLGGDLTEDGQRIGPIAIARLRGAVEKGGKEVCFYTAATFSPAHAGKQSLPMSTLAASYLRDELGVPAERVIDLVGADVFNTRGEMKKFISYTAKRGFPSDQSFISSAWWHIPRVQVIFIQMYGWKVWRRVHFRGTKEAFPPALIAFELAKWVHLFFPERVRLSIERFVRDTLGVNPSWPAFNPLKSLAAWWEWMVEAHAEAIREELEWRCKYPEQARAYDLTNGSDGTNAF